MSIRAGSKVTIIDDDLADWKISDFSELQAIINDPNIDEFGILWLVCLELGLVNETDDPSLRIEALNQDSLINELVTGEHLRSNHKEVWNRLFCEKIEERRSDLNWYRSVMTALNKNDADIQNYSDYPDVSELAECELLIIDLVFRNYPHAKPLERVTDYLKKLYTAQQSANAALPSVVLVSRNTSELEGRHQEFRHTAQISASMFRLLKKSDISDQTTGPILFEILWSQMCDEEDIAISARDLVLSLSNAVEQAENGLRSSLWNLDCDALLRMYQTCNDDSTSFTEHLIEFISRSLAWQIRNHEEFPNAILAVEEKLAARVTGAAGGLVRRFHTAGQLDQAAIKVLMHQYHWIPYSSATKLNEIDNSNIPANLDKIIPYGSVIAFSPIAIGNTVLIHITQPCDLLRFEKRYHIDSLTFVEGRLIEYGDNSSKGDSLWIVRALKIDDVYFDIEIQLKRSYIDTASVAVCSFRDRGYMIVAQLRSDVAREIGQEFARCLTRIDRPRFSEINTKSFRVLVGKRNESSQFIPIDGGHLSVQAVIRDVYDKVSDKNIGRCFHLAGKSAQAIATWCQANAAVDGLVVSEITDPLKNELWIKGVSELGPHCGIQLVKENEKSVETVVNLVNRMQHNRAINIVLVAEDIYTQYLKET